ncbi:hypothetical protein BVRB_035840, partial [Beta vulgaris subsp. vulgaris]
TQSRRTRPTPHSEAALRPHRRRTGPPSGDRPITAVRTGPNRARTPSRTVSLAPRDDPRPRGPARRRRGRTRPGGAVRLLNTARGLRQKLVVTETGAASSGPSRLPYWSVLPSLSILLALAVLVLL